MNTVIQFVQGHSAVILGLMVAILDFIFAMSPALKSNGILHAIYMMVQKPSVEEPKQ